MATLIPALGACVSRITSDRRRLARCGGRVGHLEVIQTSSQHSLKECACLVDVAQRMIEIDGLDWTVPQFRNSRVRFQAMAAAFSRWRAKPCGRYWQGAAEIARGFRGGAKLPGLSDVADHFAGIQVRRHDAESRLAKTITQTLEEIAQTPPGMQHRHAPRLGITG